LRVIPDDACDAHDERLKADPQPRSDPAGAFRTEWIAQVGKAQRVFVVAVPYLQVCKLGRLAKEAGASVAGDLRIIR